MCKSCGVRWKTEENVVLEAALSIDDAVDLAMAALATAATAIREAQGAIARRRHSEAWDGADASASAPADGVASFAADATHAAR